MRVKAITISLVLGMWTASSAAAQAPPAGPITGYVVQIRQGAVTAGSDIPITLASLTCGLPRVPPAAGPLINPTRIRFADPKSPTLDCESNQAATIRALPAGIGYSAWIAAVSNINSPPDDRSAFVVAIPNFDTTPIFGPPAAPTAVRVLQ